MISINIWTCKMELYDFLSYHSFAGSKKLTPIGKNINGDLAQIWDKTISRATWEVFVSYQFMDLTGIYSYLRVAGKVPDLPQTSLSALAKHFSLPIENLHDALGDARLTLKVFRELIKL